MPLCDLDATEDAPHAFWERPAWKGIRKKHLGCERVDARQLPPVTRHCGLLVDPVDPRELERTVPPQDGDRPPRSGSEGGMTILIRTVEEQGPRMAAVPEPGMPDAGGEPVTGWRGVTPTPKTWASRS